VQTHDQWEETAQQIQDAPAFPDVRLAAITAGAVAFILFGMLAIDCQPI